MELTRLTKEELWYMSNSFLNRVYRTIKFLDNEDFINKSIVDCGEDNPAKRMIAYHYKIRIKSKDWNFNYPLKHITKKYDTIIALEVLEHTYNPLTFLNSIKALLSENGIVYLSIPRFWPQIMRPKYHFHEIPSDRLKWLFDEAGFEIVKYKKISLRGDWYHYIFGIRPFLRGFWKTRIYKLKLK